MKAPRAQGRRRGSPKGPRRRPSLRVVRVGAGAGGRGYAVRIGDGALDDLARDLVSGRLTSGSPPSQIAVVSDATVGRLYGRQLTRALAAGGGRASLLLFPAGEIHKTRETKARLEDRLARLAFGRDGVIVALGGGVTGDLAGFVAATWHRGVPLVQAPTTVMAMLDSAIGGKVAVDHPQGKNLVGAFHPPLGVYADTRTLATLPDRELRAGIAEAMKCGAIASASLFRTIERDRAAILRREPSAIARLLLGSARVKARIVTGDERESGRRMLLNFGHTLGHAIETSAGYRLRHGEAVAIGMALESRLAVALGILAPEAAVRIESLVVGLGLPARAPRSLRIGALLAGTARDKKARGGVVRYVVPSRIGRHAGGGDFSVRIPEAMVRRVLRGAGLEG
jgi:3-dehydroquinate synthase